MLDRACAAHGLEPTVALQASAPDAVVDLAQRGLGLGILSESMTSALDRQPQGLARVRVTGIDTPAVLALVWKPVTKPALHELLHQCRSAFGLPAAA